jgi:hypothetical protein
VRGVRSAWEKARGADLEVSRDSLIFTWMSIPFVRTFPQSSGSVTFQYGSADPYL